MIRHFNVNLNSGRSKTPFSAPKTIYLSFRTFNASMNRITILLPLIILLLFSSCKKEELVTVKNNTAPPDGTIEAVVIENYINRAYILTLGREPSSSQFSFAKNLLLAANLDSSSQKIFLDSLFADPDYRKQVYNQNKINLLNNADTAEFSNWINIFQFFLQDSTYMFQWPLLQFEIDRLVLLRNAYPQYVQKSIQEEELQRRMCNNYLYDQINMGSANFVITTFQQLLNRNPTLSEQASGVSMVEGNNAILLLQAGASKNDYLTIITASTNYYEAQVVLLYRKLLNRIPDTQEMAAGTDLYKNTGDYTAVQRKIISSNEFIGLP